jgi:drug/metabolite transporter (DMT)-like permease
MSSSPTRLSPQRASPYLLLTLAPFFWACNWIIGRGLHADVPPMAMTFFRWLFGIAFMLPFAWPHLRQQWPAVRQHWRVLIPLGVVGVGIHNSFAYIGLNSTTATNGVILNSTIPIMIMALSWIFLRERLSRLQLTGLAVSIAGVLAILSHGSWEQLAGLKLNRGDIWVLGSMLLWSIYTLMLRWRPPELHMLSFLLVIACIGELTVLPLFLAEHWFVRQTVFTPDALIAFASVGLFSSFLSYVFWNRGVQQVGANVAGMFVHLMPVFGTLLAWMFLDERLQLFHVAGIALILAGIYLTTRKHGLSVPVAAE